jgi:hypothetical protein
VLSNSNDDMFRFFVQSKLSSPRVKQALEEALALKAKWVETRGLVQQEV